MSDLLEIILTSELNATNCTISAWDPRSGAQLLTYKGGGIAGPHALSFIRNEFLISANQQKPLLHIWPINSQEQIRGVKLVTPGRVQSLAVSPDGCFCIAGIAEHIYIWQICSGRLLATLSKHFQMVTNLKFTDDGSHFISAGQDGMVLVWKLSNVISLTSQSQTLNPIYSFSDHALPVSDLYVGRNGMRAYLITASLDNTCKIYDLSCGRILLTLAFPEALTAITMDHLDTRIYSGSVEGNIFEFSLQSPPRTKEYHLTGSEIKNCFTGHKGTVTSISLSLNGETMISGSADEMVILWHIHSKQIIRTIPHKGGISNTFFTLAPKAMFDQDQHLNLIITNFKRIMEPDAEDAEVEIFVGTNADMDKDYEEAETIDICDATNRHFGTVNNSSYDQDVKQLDSLRKEVQKMKNINRDLFEKSLKQILTLNTNAADDDDNASQVAIIK